MGTRVPLCFISGTAWRIVLKFGMCEIMDTPALAFISIAEGVHVRVRTFAALFRASGKIGINISA